MRSCGGFLPFAVLLWRCGFWWICGAFWQSSRVPFGCFARFLCTLGSVSALPGFIYGPLWAFILLCGFFFACGGFRPFWGLWRFAAFGPGFPVCGRASFGYNLPVVFSGSFWDPLRLLLLSWFNNSRRRASFPVSVLRVGCMAL